MANLTFKSIFHTALILFLFRLWDNAIMLSWNQPVLSNEGKVSCSRKQRGPSMLQCKTRCTCDGVWTCDCYLTSQTRYPLCNTAPIYSLVVRQSLLFFHIFLYIRITGYFVWYARCLYILIATDQIGQQQLQTICLGLHNLLLETPVLTYIQNFSWSLKMYDYWTTVKPHRKSPNRLYHTNKTCLLILHKRL